jgi:hypothetical protein
MASGNQADIAGTQEKGAGMPEEGTGIQEECTGKQKKKLEALQLLEDSKVTVSDERPLR